MNIWPLFIGMGRLGVIWITNHQKRKFFLTVVTIAFMMYHFRNEQIKQERKMIFNGDDRKGYS